jgi:predicted MFS family arabinose efflux permease
VAATAGYLAVTTGESLLAPVIPVLRGELGLGLGTAGLALGLLSGAIAAGNLGGGLLLVRRGAKQGTVVGLAVSAAGALAAAASQGRPAFLASQVLLGLGSGAFFAPGLRAVGVLGGARRRGLAMGLFGIAFSGGLALAALLAALAGTWGWRASFLAVAALAGATTVAAALAPLPGREPAPAGGRDGGFPALRRLLGSPLLVGGVVAASQYGTISFLPSFAVSSWQLSPTSAALLLAAARLLSVPAKLVFGNAADQVGSLRTAWRLGLALALIGACWTMGPYPAASAAAVGFAALVSGLGPVANVLAFDSFGGSGMLLGMFRSAQIGLGAAASATIGGASAGFGLRPVLAVAALLPLVLLPLARRPGRG